MSQPVQRLRHRPRKQLSKGHIRAVSPGAKCGSDPAAAKFSPSAVDTLTMESRPVVTSADELAALDLFREVKLDDVAELLSACAEISLAADDHLLRAGESNRGIYSIIEGTVEVRLSQPACEPILSIGPGGVVGELSIINGVSASADVVAQTSAIALVIPADVVWDFIARSHEFACNLLGILAGRVRADNIRLLASINEKLRYERAARVDALTGIHNRRWFDETVDRLLGRSALDGVSFSLMFIDIDHFKSVNDAHGHAIGDTVLRTVAECLHAGIRVVDLVARYGGEEFVILLRGITLAESRLVAERLRRDVQRRCKKIDGQEIAVTVSIGVAERVDSESAADLLAAADRAMYQAKELGRNRVEVRELPPDEIAAA